MRRRFNFSVGSRKLLAGLACCASWLGLAAVPALAQEASGFPQRTITLIVNGGAGSLPDIFARPLAEQLQQSLGQTVVVDNRPGAGGMVALQQLKGSDGSGHTLAIVTNAHAVWSPYIFPKLTYDPAVDLKPVSPIAVLPMALVVNPKVQAKNLKELFALAKAQPGVLNYASSGNGSPPHVLFEVLLSQAGKPDIVHIPFKTGPDALMSTVAGDTQIYFAGSALVEPMLKDGRLRALAVSPAVQSEGFAQVPTLEQEGHAGFESAVWIGLVAHKDTPDAVVAVLNRAVTQALQAPAYLATMQANGSIPYPDSAAGFAQRIARERSEWAPQLERLGIRPN